MCAFVTNEYMQEGTKELPSNAKISLKDVKLYLSSTKLEIENLLKTNCEELEVTLNNILQASGKIVTEQLAEYSHAVSLTNLNDIVIGLESIREDLKLMNKITQDLRINASQLDIGKSERDFLETIVPSAVKIWFLLLLQENLQGNLQGNSLLPPCQFLTLRSFAGITVDKPEGLIVFRNRDTKLRDVGVGNQTC